MLLHLTTQVDQAQPISKFKIQKVEVTSEGTHQTSQERILIRTRKVNRYPASIMEIQRLAA
jgi:hypothetical protein